MTKLASSCAVLLLFLVVLYDSRSHFDRHHVETKRKHYSAQRNWNLFFGQDNVYFSGGVRHEADFSKLLNVLDVDSYIISDINTSYYIAAHLPNYILNVHRHHGRHRSGLWRKLEYGNVLCYIDAEGNIDKLRKAYFSQKLKRQRPESIPASMYIVLNKEQNNINFKRDCLSQRRGPMISQIDNIASLVYEGDTVFVYKLLPASSQRDKYGSE